MQLNEFNSHISQFFTIVAFSKSEAETTKIALPIILFFSLHQVHKMNAVKSSHAIIHMTVISMYGNSYTMIDKAVNLTMIHVTQR